MSLAVCVLPAISQGLAALATELGSQIQGHGDILAHRILERDISMCAMGTE